MFIGVDVGGTNSDAVVIEDGEVISWAKETTSSDVTQGVKSVIESALKNLETKRASPVSSKDIRRISIGIL